MLTNLGRVVGGTKNQLGGSVVARTNVRHIRLILDENLGAAEIAQLEDATVGVEQEILGLDVAMTDALRVDVGECSEELVNVELDLESRHDSLHLVEVTRSTIDRFRDEFLHEVEVDFIFLGSSVRVGGGEAGERRTRSPFE